MSRFKTLPFIVIILFCAAQNHASEPAERNGLVPYVSDKLRTSINKLFHYLKINKKFRHSYKIKLMLTMYDNLYNNIEYNWKILSDVKNSVIVGDDIKDNYLLKIVNEVFQYNDTDNNNSVKAENITFIPTKEEKDNASAANYITSTLKIGNKTKETECKFGKIVEKVLDEINKITVNDSIGEPLNKTHLKYKLQRRRNFDLKTWDPNEYPNDKLSISRRMAVAELIKQFPFVASIHIMDKLTCAGSIISKHAVLTTATCLPFAFESKMIVQMPDIIKVRIGSDYANNFGELVPVVDVEFHPEYDPKTLKNNLAIIRLDKLQKYARVRPKIRKIRLDNNPFGPRSYMSHVQIFGFGAGNDEIPKSEQRLTVTYLDPIPLQECKDIYTLQFVNQGHFCAGFTTRRNNLCHGDVGAPGVADGLLVGIVSFGPPVCGKKNSPTVFIKIGAFANWIDSVIKQKWMYPLQHLGIPEPSTGIFHGKDRMFLPTLQTKPQPNIIMQKQNIFNEIKSVLEHFTNLGNFAPNKSLLGEKENDEDQDPLYFIFGSTTTKSIHHHPLFNKSILPVPGVHFTTKKSTYTPPTRMSRPDIGLPDYLPYDYIHSKIKDSEELDYFIQMLIKEMMPRSWVPQSKIFTTKSMLWRDNFFRNEPNHKTTETKTLKSIYIFNNKVPSIAVTERNVELKKDDKSLKPILDNRIPRFGIRKLIGHKITRPYATLFPVKYKSINYKI